MAQIPIQYEVIYVDQNHERWKLKLEVDAQYWDSTTTASKPWFDFSSLPVGAIPKSLTGTWGAYQELAIYDAPNFGATTGSTAFPLNVTLSIKFIQFVFAKRNGKYYVLNEWKVETGVEFRKVHPQTPTNDKTVSIAKAGGVVHRFRALNPKKKYGPQSNDSCQELDVNLSAVRFNTKLGTLLPVEAPHGPQ